MDRTRYTFDARWWVDAPHGDVYEALLAVDAYPSWWPEVREVASLGDDRFEIVVRSVLPYRLRFVLERDVADRESCTLRARMTGDLEGYSQWSVRPATGGSVVAFEEDVVLRRPLLNALAPVARSAFRANHALMMRRGAARLRVFLAGYRLGRASTGGANGVPM